MMKTEVRRMVLAAAAACEDKKAERITVLELDPADSGFTDCFLICSGSNERQNQTIANGIEQALERSFGTRPNSVEGYRRADWILLDYVDFVVHIFSEEKRDFYDIERLRKTASPLSLEDLKNSVREKIAQVRRKQAVKSATAKPAKKRAAPAKGAAKKAVRSSTSDRKAAGKARRSSAKETR